MAKGSKKAKGASAGKKPKKKGHRPIAVYENQAYHLLKLIEARGGTPQPHSKATMKKTREVWKRGKK